MTRPAEIHAVPEADDPILVELVEELTDQLQAGVPVDLSAVVRYHPEHAAELRRLLPALRALAGADRSTDFSSPRAMASRIWPPSC